MRHRMNLMTVVMLSGTLALCAAAGCASRTTKTTQTVAVEEPAAGIDEAPQPRPAEQSVTTTTTTTETDRSSPGIIGSAFGLVWAVVSFPFRVIGALV
jgi:hypothetical protein